MNTVAQTIASQIGNRAFAMMGAKNIGASGNSLMWKIGANAKKITHITVELMSDDTYTVTFHKISKGGAKWDKHAVPMVYADNLHRVIESETGLYLSL